MHNQNQSDSASIFKILNGKRFIGLFITQFLTSFNDNFFKNAIIAMLNFGVMASLFTDEQRQQWVIIAGLCFILPYFLFSATAGKLAEKYDRITIVHIIKFSEIAILGLGGVGFILQNLYLMLSMLFLMGTHSTFFSPIKFGILPTYLHRSQLVGGNALIETATFIAIILGTILGTQLILLPEYGEVFSLIMMIIVAFTGLYTSYMMPRIKNSLPDMHMSLNIIQHNIEIFKIMLASPKVLKYILAGGWFWFVAAVVMIVLPTYISDVLAMNKDVYTLILVLFSVGVGSGSVFCAKLLDGNISARFTPVAALVMGVFAIDIGYISEAFTDADHLATLAIFLDSFTGWRIMFDFFIIAAAGGLYVVPFFALVQDETSQHEKSRMIAGNNIINAFAMVLSGLYMLLTSALHISIPVVFIMTGILCFVGGFIVHIVLEDSVLRRKKY
ncbi:MAG: MFS transporter [Pseudomonadota bacterium]